MGATARSVHSHVGTKACPKRRHAADNRNRVVFQFATLFMVVLAMFGIGRVTIMAKAAEVSFETARLAAVIEDEREKGEILELSRINLATPSRIESIAAGSLNMRPAKQVSYLAVKMPDGGSEWAEKQSPAIDSASSGGYSISFNPARVSPGEPAESKTIASFVTSVMELSVGEAAHALLSGGAGSATLR